MEKNYIWIKTGFIGFHKYPNAPKEVEYLKNNHRHTFNIKVKIQVFHLGRELEFHMFKSYIDSLLTEREMNFMSCEMICEKLYNSISYKYPERDIIINVDEDGEVGSESIYLIEGE